MDNQDKSVEETPVASEKIDFAEATTSPDAITKPVEDVEVKDPSSEVKKEEEVAPVVDRSAYNCPDCGGEGLKKAEDGTLVDCTNCGNTGKV